MEKVNHLLVIIARYSVFKSDNKNCVLKLKKIFKLF